MTMKILLAFAALLVASLAAAQPAGKRRNGPLDLSSFMIQRSGT